MATRFALLTVGLLLALTHCGTRPGGPGQELLAPLVVRPPQGAGPTVAQQLARHLDTAAPARATWPELSRVRAFYGPTPALAWTQPNGRPNAAADTLLTLLAVAPTYGLRPTDYATPALLSLRDSLAPGPDPTHQADRVARFDIGLTAAGLRFMLALHRGRLRPAAWSPLERRAGQEFPYAAALRAGLARGQVRRAVLAAQPGSREYRLLQVALARRLRRPAPPDSATRWQEQNELLALNLERWRWEAIPDSEYALVNLPAFGLEVVRGGHVVQAHRVIVGQPATPTPTLSSAITHFTIAPDWHVPRSIATREMLPRLREDAAYLALNDLALYDAHGSRLDPARINWQQVTPRSFAYQIRQAPGCENALGNVVFRFPNPYSVYLHDTPMRQFFDQSRRAFSHGCIRLDQPMQLAAYLLRREDRTAHLPSEAECIRQPQPRTFRLRRPLPLHVRYATCAVVRGQLRCYPDIYHRDDALREQLRTPPAQPMP